MGWFLLTMAILGIFAAFIYMPAMLRLDEKIRKVAQTAGGKDGENA